MTFKSAQEATRANEKAEKGTRKETRVEEICDRYMDVLRSSTPLQLTQMEYCNVDEASGAGGVLNLRKDLQTSLDSLSHLDILRTPLSPIHDTPFVPCTSHSVSTSSYSPPSYSKTTQNVTFAHTVSTTTPNPQCPAEGRRRMPNTHHSREVSPVALIFTVHSCHTLDTC